MPMLLSLLSQKGPIRLARAFLQNPTTKRGIVASTTFPASTNPSNQQRFRSSSKLDISVEDDLDQALSSILGDSRKDNRAEAIKDVIPTKKQGAHLEKVSLADLIEETKVRFYESCLGVA